MTSTILVRLDNAQGGVERELKRFKRMCDALGIQREYRQRMEYRPPSARRLEKLRAAEKRRNKASLRNVKSTKI